MEAGSRHANAASAAANARTRLWRINGHRPQDSSRFKRPTSHRTWAWGYASNGISNSIKFSATARAGGGDPPIRIRRHPEERRHGRLIAALNRKIYILTATSAKSF
jgi:hypothetical protein